MNEQLKELMEKGGIYALMREDAEGQVLFFKEVKSDGDTINIVLTDNTKEMAIGSLEEVKDCKDALAAHITFEIVEIDVVED